MQPQRHGGGRIHRGYMYALQRDRRLHSHALEALHCRYSTKYMQLVGQALDVSKSHPTRPASSDASLSQLLRSTHCYPVPKYCTLHTLYNQPPSCNFASIQPVRRPYSLCLPPFLPPSLPSSLLFLYFEISLSASKFPRQYCSCSRIAEPSIDSYRTA